MNTRAAIMVVMCLLLVGLSGCFPIPAETPESSTPVASEMPTQPQAESSALLEEKSTEESLPEEDSGLLLVAPTLAPTATPGVIYSVVQQAVEATNLEEAELIGLSAADWINLIISLFLVFITLTLIARIIFLILRGIARRTATPYDEIYLESIKPYLRWLFGTVVLYIATLRLQFISPQIKQWLGQIYFIFFVVLIVICLWKLVDIFTIWYQDKVKDQGERDGKEAVLTLGERTIRFLLIMVGLLIILDHVGFNISALVAAIGIGGLAISLAAQDTIANMISGVIILMDQPFRAGDRIEIQELNTWGDVVSIGLRSTRIRTRDNRLVIVPNSSISNNQVVNYTFPDPRYRIQTEIGVAYGTDLRKVREVITAALQGVEGVIPDKPDRKSVV